MTTATEIQTTVQITKVSDDIGKNGQAQWELKVKWPWMPPNAKYGDTLWLDVSDFPEKPAIAVHNAIAVKNTIKGTKDGNPPHNGSKDWMWNWRILSLDSSTMPEPTQQGIYDTLGIDPPFTGKPDAPKRPNDGPPDWDAIHAAKDQTIQLNAATRDAMIFIQIGVWPIPEGRTSTSWLRECRARLYYNVHTCEMEPEYWCYIHNCARNKGSNGYGHTLTHDQLELNEGRALPTGATGTCIWEKGVVQDSDPGGK